MANIPSKDSDHIKSSYAEHAKSYADYWSVPFSFTEVDRRMFESLMPPNGSILDLGCGPGNDAVYFTKRGFSVIGIDLSEPLLEIAARRAPEARFMPMDMAHLDFDDGSFEGVWASFSFLHIKSNDAKAVLTGFRRVLRKSGLLFLGLHTHETTRWRNTVISGLFKKDGQPVTTYVQEWNQVEIVKLLEALDFKIVRSRSFLRKGGLYPLLSIISSI